MGQGNKAYPMFWQSISKIIDFKEMSYEGSNYKH